jgi:transcriptional regulator with GAF, ATPase, and Fis domain
LVDSQLFGHERGSFTGATGSHKGWFERADGGTLFLDEIGELPPAAQVRLLRILQYGTFERVGGQKQLNVYVRVVAATHLDLREMVRRGDFRDDLWYRIAVFPLVIPPLRERTEDIPALAAHFALRAAKRLGAPPLTPSDSDIWRLVAYPWPGNIRELAAVIERAVILGNKNGLAVDQALGIEGSMGPRDFPSCAEVAPSRPGTRSFPSLDEIMRKHIEAALMQSRGRVEGPDGAARLLEINPYTLRARMRKLGIHWAAFRTDLSALPPLMPAGISLLPKKDLGGF